MLMVQQYAVVSPINVSVDISCGPDMPVGDIFKP